MKKILFASLVALTLAGCGSGSVSGPSLSLSKTTGFAASAKSALSGYQTVDYDTFAKSITIQAGRNPEAFRGKRYAVSGLLLFQKHPGALDGLVPFDSSYTWDAGLYEPSGQYIGRCLTMLKKHFLTENSAVEYYQKLGAARTNRGDIKPVTVYFTFYPDSEHLSHEYDVKAIRLSSGEIVTP